MIPPGITALSVSDGQGTSSVVDPLWHVYRAWCDTHDQPPADPASITGFLQACTGSPAQQTRRRRELLKVEGIPSTPAPRVHASAWRTGPDWLTLPDALRALPIHDSLHDPRARRDAVVLLLLGHLQLIKHTAAAATAAACPLPTCLPPQTRSRAPAVSRPGGYALSPTPASPLMTAQACMSSTSTTAATRFRTGGNTAPCSPLSTVTAPSKPPEAPPSARATSAGSRHTGNAPNGGHASTPEAGSTDGAAAVDDPAGGGPGATGVAGTAYLTAAAASTNCRGVGDSSRRSQALERGLHGRRGACRVFRRVAVVEEDEVEEHSQHVESERAHR